MRKILVIEDDPAILDNILETLELEAYEVYGAANGVIGVQMARQVMPDLIICDIMMPQMDGYGVLLELHSDSATSFIPFVFLTAKAELKDIRMGMELGADDYLTKPFLPTQLLTAIKTRMEKYVKAQEQHRRQIDDMRNTIIHSLPHELRTPLTGILGYVGILMEDYRAGDAASLGEMLAAIQRSALRLSRLVENYLLYVQLEVLQSRDGSGSPSKHSTDAGMVIRDMAQTKAKTVRREGDLTLQLESATIQIDQDSFKKIVEELIDNAFKFSKAGSMVEVANRCEGNTFILTVRDHGRGMTPDQVANIGAYMQFERRIYEQQGSGLGLIIAKRLTEFNGGSFSLQSVHGESTVVTIKLRLTESDGGTK